MVYNRKADNNNELVLMDGPRIDTIGMSIAFDCNYTGGNEWLEKIVYDDRLSPEDKTKMLLGGPYRSNDWGACWNWFQGSNPDKVVVINGFLRDYPLGGDSHKIVTPNAKMTSFTYKEKDKLSEVFVKIKETPKYQVIVDALAKTPYKITGFEVQLKDEGAYASLGRDGVIRFSDIDMINTESVVHELIHALQFGVNTPSDITSERIGMLEFENAFIRDVMHFMTSPKGSEYNDWAVKSGYSQESIEKNRQYKKWLKKMTKNKKVWPTIDSRQSKKFSQVSEFFTISERNFYKRYSYGHEDYTPRASIVLFDVHRSIDEAINKHNNPKKT